MALAIGHSSLASLLLRPAACCEVARQRNKKGAKGDDHQDERLDRGPTCLGVPASRRDTDCKTDRGIIVQSVHCVCVLSSDIGGREGREGGRGGRRRRDMHR